MLDGDQNATALIIGCAIEVHRQLGPGLLESVYESALCIEFQANDVGYRRQVGVPLYYRGHRISEHRLDLIVAESVVVEVKCVTRHDPVHVAQLLTYLRITGIHVGLLINFNTAVLRHGIRRVVLTA
jgi:GxxExxY protein